MRSIDAVFELRLVQDGDRIIPKDFQSLAVAAKRKPPFTDFLQMRAIL
jgi:hypothetical protein